MKQSRTEKAVFAKLSTEKVELALELGGIKSMARTLKANIKAYNEEFSTLDNLVMRIRKQAQDLDGRVEKFYSEVQELKKEGQQQAKELGVDFNKTPIGQEVEEIEASILRGELSTIKEGLRIKI